MKINDYTKNRTMFRRSLKVNLNGIYGHMSPGMNFPATDYPFFAAKASGCRFWDIDGNEFIDLSCAYGPMILGYGNRKINDAVMKQMARADTTMCASPVMVELGEYLVDMVPMADWAFFAKNGADVIIYSAMIARAATGRKKIVIFNGSYHGTSPWMQMPGRHGVIEEDARHIIRIPWNDYDAFENAVNENRGDIAALIATPYHVPNFADNELPAVGYWQRMDALCKKEGIILVSDDIRHCFRHDYRGSHEFFGYKPDLVCFCKALANGYPISALLGSRELRASAAKTYHTGSYWFQAAPMAAALACLKEIRKRDVPRIVMRQGKKLTDGIVEQARAYGYDMKVSGSAAMPYLRIMNDESQMLHQNWCAEVTKRGVFLTSHHNLFLSAAHTDKDIARIHQVTDEAFKTVKIQYGT